MKTLKKLHLRSVSESLSDKEMKLVVGGAVYVGYGSGGTCGAYIPIAGAAQYSIPNPSFGNLSSAVSFNAESVSGTTTSTVWRGVSQSIAQQMTQGISGAKWCCDNCGSASWY